MILEANLLADPWVITVGGGLLILLVVGISRWLLGRGYRRWKVLSAVGIATTLVVLGIAALASEDDSPETSGEPGSVVAETDGNQPVDTDRDGLPNTGDRCPDEAGDAATDGCPDRDGDGLADIDDRCPGKAASTSDGCPEEPQEVTLDTLYDQDRVTPSVAADLRDILVGGESDPAGGYMYIGGAYDAATIRIATNREFEFIEGTIGIISNAECPENGAELAIRSGPPNEQELWSGNTEDGPQDFHVRIASLDSVVLYARAEGSFPAGCSEAQIGWADVRLIAP
jgi:hypothetical protein